MELTRIDQTIDEVAYSSGGKVLQTVRGGLETAFLDPYADSHHLDGALILPGKTGVAWVSMAGGSDEEDPVAWRNFVVGCEGTMMPFMENNSIEMDSLDHLVWDLYMSPKELSKCQTIVRSVIEGESFEDDVAESCLVTDPNDTLDQRLFRPYLSKQRHEDGDYTVEHRIDDGEIRLEKREAWSFEVDVQQRFEAFLAFAARPSDCLGEDELAAFRVMTPKERSVRGWATACGWMPVVIVRPESAKLPSSMKGMEVIFVWQTSTRRREGARP